jgi:hypothetical protein
MVEIQGYRSKGKDIRKIEDILNKARSKIQKEIISIYHEMLSTEIADVVDDIQERLVERPNVSILKVAENMLNKRISLANRGLNTEYNLEASVFVLTDDKDTYYLLKAKNPRLKEVFGKVSGIETYILESSLSLVGTEKEETEKTKKWNELKAKYGQNMPEIAMKAMLSSPIYLDTSLLKFASVGERAEVRARHKYTNGLLSQYANNEAIPPNRLMPLLDLAVDRLTDIESQEWLKFHAGELRGILEEITLEMIMLDPATNMGAKQRSESFVDTEVDVGGQAVEEGV